MRIVVRDDGGAALWKPRKNLGFRHRDIGFGGEEFAVRRCHPGDDGDVRAHQLGQFGQFAAVVHAHFEHAKARGRRHPRQRQGYTGVVVVAFHAGVHGIRRKA